MMWSGLSGDIRSALRTLAREPGPTLMSALILATAIGLAGAGLVVFDSFLVAAPAGVIDPATVVRVPGSQLRGPHQYADLTQHVSSVWLGIESGPIAFSMHGTNEPIYGRFVSRNYLSLLRTRTVAGMSLDLVPSRNDTAVIGHSLWLRIFDGSHSAIGGTIKLSDRLLTVVGVVDPQFKGVEPARVDLWLPIEAAPVSKDGFWVGGPFRLVGRVRPGVSVAVASQELAAYYPSDAIREGNQATPLNVEAVYEGVGARLRRLDRFAVALVIAALALLTACCAHTAALTLIRTLRRNNELKTRRQLGASSWILARQVFIEVTLLTALAGAGGAILVVWLVPMLVKIVAPPVSDRLVASALPEIMFRWHSLNDAVGPALLRVAAITAVLVLVSTVLTATAAAMFAVKTSRHYYSWSRSAGSSRLRFSLVAIEVMFTVLLLAAAGLFARSYGQAQGVDFGVNGANLLVASPRQERESIDTALLEQLGGRLAQLPAVTGWALSSSIPVGRHGKLQMAIDVRNRQWPWGRETAAGLARPFVEAVSPTYFELLGISVQRGRGFSTEDDRTDLVIVVDDRVAREVFGGDDPLGECVELAFDGAVKGGLFQRRCRQIVGVVSSVRADIVRFAGERGKYDPAFYVPVAQWVGARCILIRFSGDPSRAFGQVNSLLQSVDARWPPMRLEFLSQYVAQEAHLWAVGTALLGSLATVGLFVAALGTYTLIAFSVRQRFDEIGIRLALGATTRQILRAVLVDGIKPVVVGLCGGLILSVVSGRFVDSLLFGVGALDLYTFLSVALVTVLAGIVGCTGPALTAARLSPASLLRVQ